MKNGGIAAIFLLHAAPVAPIEPHALRRTVLSLSHHTGCRKPDLQCSVSSAVAPAALIVGERGKRICGEENLCEFLPAEAGARSECCGFHIDDITACPAAGFYFFLRLAKEAVACPCDSRREGDALLFHPCLDAKARGFIEGDPVAHLLIVEGRPFLAEGFFYGEEGILRKTRECAAAADGEDLFCAVGIGSSISTAAGAPTGACMSAMGPSDVWSS